MFGLMASQVNPGDEGSSGLAEGNTIPGDPWMYGLAGLAILLLLLWVMTRFNAER